MLKLIEIENFVFFKKATLKFHPGVNIFTGETGAGKTIFLNALNITLGKKIPHFSIRSGENRVKVTTVFDIKDQIEIKQKLEDLGHEVESELVIQREISREGKSKSKINGELTTTQNLKEISKQLIDLHSQHENQKLLNDKEHLFFLDSIAHLDDSLDQFKRDYLVYQKKNNQWKQFLEHEKKIKEEKNFLEFTIKDLKIVLSQEEYDQSKQNLKRLELEQKRNESFYHIDQLFKEQIILGLEKSLSILRGLVQDDQVENVVTRLHQILEETEEAKNQLLKKADFSQDYNDQIDEINARLARTESKLKKYGLPIDQLFDRLKQAEEKLDFIENVDFEKEELKKQLHHCYQEVFLQAKKLHAIRQKEKINLEEKISREFQYLGMKEARLVIDLKPVLSTDEEQVVPVRLTENGFSQAEFLYSPAKEITAKPLKKIASGGEISRIMLAIKTVLNQEISNKTVVFDEIDAGVGGKTAVHIGEKIKEIGEKTQVIVITHLPQIAKFADRHFKIEKVLDVEGTTSSKITLLSEEEIVYEFARMLGKKVTDKTISLAKELMKKN